jgi:hypothetical protein
MIILNLALPERTCYEPLASTHPGTQGCADLRRTLGGQGHASDRQPKIYGTVDAADVKIAIEFGWCDESRMRAYAGGTDGDWYRYLSASQCVTRS